MRRNEQLEIIEIFARAMSGEKNVLEKYEEERGALAVKCSYLSKDMTPEKEVWEKLGFTFTEIEGDDVLYKATLPNGWKIVNTDHHMYKDIVDENGYKRATMFYKAAIYDRTSYMNLIPRYGCNEYYVYSSKENVVYFGNPNEILFEVDRIKEDDPKSHSKWEEAYAKAEQFGKEFYPDYKNPLAYWEQPQKDKQPKLD